MGDVFLLVDEGIRWKIRSHICVFMHKVTRDS